MNRLAAFLTVVFLAVPAEAPAQNAIATFNGETVETSAFEQRYKEYLARTGTQDAARLRSAVLAQIINDRLIIADGRRRGLDDDAAYHHYEASARRKLLVESYLAHEVLDAVRVTDDDVEDAFVRINTEIEARHLFARTEKEAQRLYVRLLAGESFEDLAREVFIDPSLAANGGAIGRFTFDDLDPDFEDAAFGLEVGEISAPVRTAQGYSIIQVLDRFTKPILTELEYAQRKDKLRAFVLHKKQVQARSHFVRSQAEQMRPTFHAGFERLFGQITGLVLIDEEAMDDFLREPLISFDADGSRATWTIAEFREHAAFTPAEHRAQVRTEADLQQFVTALVVRAKMMKAATNSGLDARPEYEQALTEATDAWVLERQKERFVDHVDVPEDSVIAHYERHSTEFTDDDGTALSFDEARARIAEQLRLVYTSRATLQFIASLRRDADIRINEDVVRSVTVPGRTASPSRSASAQPSDDGAGRMH